MEESEKRMERTKKWKNGQKRYNGKMDKSDTMEAAQVGTSVADSSGMVTRYLSNPLIEGESITATQVQYASPRFDYVSILCKQEEEPSISSRFTRISQYASR
ncbi:hypothetical protein Adt_39753 [Abeliophyllum distichum]|uniref:Uncharacterized protein n=1 Tax=Abeliophyllum distichum TaxID=126358 RepID=A0ABD1Q5Z1_9LAMI